jgi:hypothetical protein
LVHLRDLGDAAGGVHQCTFVGAGPITFGVPAEGGCDDLRGSSDGSWGSVVGWSGPPGQVTGEAF